MDTNTSALLQMAESEPSELINKANEFRQRHFGRDVTYSRSVFVPLTRQCRNACSYCGFVSQSASSWMDLDRINSVLKSGKCADVSEVLFTMGEKPEDVHESARRFLKSKGYNTTVEYTHAANEVALLSHRLLPHTNAGVLLEDDFRHLAPMNASMGLMLESSAERLCGIGMPHERSPFKSPSLRVESIRLAGRMKVPFTSGVLLGIGETQLERAQSFELLAKLHQEGGHLQEVIVQAFKPLPGTPMESSLPISDSQFLINVALARLILPPDVSIQVPPNLTVGSTVDCLHAGANDLGGVSPVTIDHINPTSPWPQIGEMTQELAKHGFILNERLPVYEKYLHWTSPLVREIIREEFAHVY